MFLLFILGISVLSLFYINYLLFTAFTIYQCITQKYHIIWSRTKWKVEILERFLKRNKVFILFPIRLHDNVLPKVCTLILEPIRRDNCYIKQALLKAVQYVSAHPKVWAPNFF